MKWTNKGHEFDEIGNMLAQTEGIYIYGAGVIGRQIHAALAPLHCVKGFIDQNKALQNAQLLGSNVFAPEDFLRTPAKNDIVVIAIENRAITLLVQKRFICAGYRQGVNLFCADEFMRFYLGIYALNKHGKLYSSVAAAGVTSICNLRCKDCVSGVPYLKNAKHRDIQLVIDTVDDFFSVFDFVGELVLSGGEAGKIHYE